MQELIQENTHKGQYLSLDGCLISFRLLNNTFDQVRIKNQISYGHNYQAHNAGFYREDKPTEVGQWTEGKHLRQKHPDTYDDGYCNGICNKMLYEINDLSLNDLFGQIPDKIPGSIHHRYQRTNSYTDDPKSDDENNG